MAGGMPQRVWFDRWSFGPDAKEDSAGLVETGRALRADLERLKADQGIDESRIVLGGNSMGGGASLFTALSTLAGDEGSLLGLAGVFSLSSWVTTQSSMWATLDKSKEILEADETGARWPPVFMAHGDQDGLIAPAWGEATKKGLEVRGFKVDWLLERGLDHEPGPLGLQKLLVWILSTIPE
eukprot:CAMPEP_0172633166 /NCGR_PEP_ID=MMETSP1068-20121228/187917_1 /TAXON_ID=35684 /ORGANISM="Pseudopedinella elastica, Strain CCMP716" /LENGTH=181 /DNA_ID=CAMNT_0013444783 /DNA_START=220 /DNA_END=765 /DNA_ORIENTATION=-